jgi:hypothetical protein
VAAPGRAHDVGWASRDTAPDSAYTLDGRARVPGQVEPSPPLASTASNDPPLW